MFHTSAIINAKMRPEADGWQVQVIFFSQGGKHNNVENGKQGNRNPHQRKA